MQQITPCLWFDNEAEEASQFYVSIFNNSPGVTVKSIIHTISRYGDEGFDVHGQKAGTVLTVRFSLNGQNYTALNGGPIFQFSEAISFQIYCDTQNEIDYYWNELSNGGSESQCGWLKDKFGISWQIIPSILPELMSDKERGGRVMQAFLRMKKFDIQKLLDA